MKEKITKINRTLFELMTGIVLFGVFCEIIMLFLGAKAQDSIGLWIGTFVAIFSAWHMWYTLDKGLDLSEGDSGKYIASRASIRYIIIVVVLVLVGVTGIGNVLTTFIGVMGLKIGAYAQPFTKRISRLIYGEEILPEMIIEENEETAGEQK